MYSVALLYLFCILAGFALIKVPLYGYFEPLEPLAFLVGVLTVLLFSGVIIFNGIMTLFRKK
ncbi:hypothetical protein [Salinibacillus xinjiangensis]|uniref:DUF3955 domain-containing protein n=1 Tax=Salinibacillus xinjiangensis TaxID=1229268 RepID=A0A6G1X8B0_9BACI|nr:hypothetical protein [Salinibacillus xinjiangensis]MRG87169.1 hypothetical protein [Salinibacillus xinjiangensis]